MVSASLSTKGETLGVVGESGCGKSTTARLLMHLIEPDAGSLVLDGDPVGMAAFGVRELRRQRADGVPGQLRLAQSASYHGGGDRIRSARAGHCPPLRRGHGHGRHCRLVGLEPVTVRRPLSA